MTTRWSEYDTLKLIRLYESYEFLWDRTSELYKNIFARKQAYEAIVEEMAIPGLTSQDVRCKIKNLRTSYYHELRKMASYKAKNKVLKPLKWFVAFRSVMGSISSELVPKEMETNSESEEAEEEDGQSGQMEDIDETSNSDAYVVSIKQEFLDEMDNFGDKEMPPTICDYLEPVVPKRAKIMEPKKIEVTAPPKRSKSVDEFQMFANNIAQQLRKLPLRRALNLQIEVQTMIAKERIDMLKKQEEKNEEESL